MTKLVFVRLSRNANVAPSGKRSTKQPKKATRVSRAGLMTVDAQSSSFGEQLEEAFVRNVRKARRENKRLFGTADFAPRKA